MDLTGLYPELEDSDSIYSVKTYSELMAAALQPRHAEFTAATKATAASTLTNVGPLSIAATETFNNDFVVADVSGAIKVTKAGIYSIDYVIRPTGNPGNTGIFARLPASVLLTAAQGQGGSLIWEVACSAAAKYLPANTVITFTVVTANATSVEPKVRITKHSGVIP